MSVRKTKSDGWSSARCPLNEINCLFSRRWLKEPHELLPRLLLELQGMEHPAAESHLTLLKPPKTCHAHPEIRFKKKLWKQSPKLKTALTKVDIYSTVRTKAHAEGAQKVSYGDMKIWLNYQQRCCMQIRLHFNFISGHTNEGLLKNANELYH